MGDVMCQRCGRSVDRSAGLVVDLKQAVGLLPTDPDHRLLAEITIMRVRDEAASTAIGASDCLAGTCAHRYPGDCLEALRESTDASARRASSSGWIPCPDPSCPGVLEADDGRGSVCDRCRRVWGALPSPQPPPAVDARALEIVGMAARGAWRWWRRLRRLGPRRFGR